eukprot:g79566.t1
MAEAWLFSWENCLLDWDLPPDEAKRVAEALEAEGYVQSDTAVLTRDCLLELDLSLKGAYITRILDGVREVQTILQRAGTPLYGLRLEAHAEQVDLKHKDTKIGHDTAVLTTTPPAQIKLTKLHVEYSRM